MQAESPEITTLRAENKGTLPSFAWPGGYPLFYMTKKGAVLCPKCANMNCDSDILDPVTGADVHWEGEPISCEGCDAEIESAYGPVNAE